MEVRIIKINNIGINLLVDLQKMLSHKHRAKKAESLMGVELVTFHPREGMLNG